jgi:hypothetical protein
VKNAAADCRQEPRRLFPATSTLGLVITITLTPTSRLIRNINIPTNQVRKNARR